MTSPLQQGRTDRHRLAPATLAGAVAVGVLLVASWLAVAAGVGYGTMAALGRGTVAEVPVHLAAPVAWTEGLYPCVEGWSPDGSSCEPAASPDVWPGGEALPVRRAGVLVASAPLDVTTAADPVTNLLGTGSSWGGLVAGGLVGLLLAPVLRTTAAGRPFAARNDRRLALAAGCVGLAWALGTVGSYVAATRVIAALEATPRLTATDAPVTLPAGWLTPALQVAWWPVALAFLLAALAAATRRGARLAADTEGLV